MTYLLTSTEQEELKKELARLRFRVAHNAWPPSGMPENEWEAHLLKYPTARSEEKYKTDRIEALLLLIGQHNAAIRRIAHALGDVVCGGVDTEKEINQETGEPYGPGGHPGFALEKAALTASRRHT